MFCSLFFPVLLLSAAQAWWCTGHMLVAQVAMHDLLATSPSTYSSVEAVLAPLVGLTHGISNNMVESACWADDIKEYGLNAFNEWHYLNKPYNYDGSINVISETGPDALWAISQALSTLSSSERAGAALEDAIQLRLLIHIVGDIHQPLHVATLFNRKFTTGDEGGNSYSILYDASINELHALWDAGLGNLEDDVPRPLTNTTSAQLASLAEQFMTNYTRYDLVNELQETDREIWTIDGFHLAIEEVYQGVQENQRPSPAYLARGWQLVMKQIALGGYRLADLLRQLYGPSFS
jgi:hypothetical protein